MSTPLHRFVVGLSSDSAERPTVAPADLAAATAAWGPGAVGWAVAVSRRCVEQVLAAMSTDHAAMFGPELRRAVEASALALLEALGGDARQFALNADQVALVQRMARLGMPYASVVQGLRIVQREVTESLLDRMDRHRPARERLPLFRSTTGVVATFFDDSVDAVVTVYLAELQRLMAQTLSSRRQTISTLIAGGRVSPDAVRRALSVDLAHHHLALILWSPQPDASVELHATLERTAAQAADALRAPPPVAMPGDDHALWCWISRAAPFPADHLEALADLPTARPYEVRIAAGVPARGGAGFRRSHLAACDAHRVARHGSPQPVIGHRDVGVVALLSADPERARWFVAEELAGLAAADPGTADLRATALRYLESHGSLVRTAAALHVHRNTVVYRLKSIRRLLRRGIDERPLETYAALTLADRLGATVLAPDAGPARDASLT